jgi:aldose 1-epimerase
MHHLSRPKETRKKQMKFKYLFKIKGSCRGHVLSLAAMLAGALVAACGPTDERARPQAATPARTTEEAPVTTEQRLEPRHYGTLADGTEVTIVTLVNANGMEVDVISYGGIITRLTAPDKEGNMGDVVLGLDTLDEYVESNPYFGALIGRYGNRIAGGEFTLLGTTYQLDTNDGDNHLHGGLMGFDRKNWGMRPFGTETGRGVILTLTSPDGDQGYPGTLEVEVTYLLTDDDELDIRFSAATDLPTIVNLTGHSYFNLAGAGDILGHQLMIPADEFTPVGPGLIPTGELRAVEGTPFDFRQPKAIGRDIGIEDGQLTLGLGYDHNFVLKDDADDELILAARVTEPTTGRVLEVHSIEPGVQFYSGNFLDGTLEGKGTVYEYRSGLCLEPQHFPDSPNQPGFPSTTLMPGETYATRIVYRFSTAE